MAKNIAIVVQRYGNEVNGGAELHARLLAEKLLELYDVDVLTTTAIDYHGWKNYFNSGTENINGINVIRFPTITSSKKQLRKARRGILGTKKYFKILKFFGLFDFLNKKYNLSNPSSQDVNNWLIKQGPYCPDMIEYIKDNQDRYCAFIFFTYLYYPTAVGMRLVREKSIFIPTAHDEKIMFTKPYEDIFSLPAFIMYNTISEKNLVEGKFQNPTKKSDIAGVGISKSKNLEKSQISEKYNFDFPYFVYIGRIDKSKGCKELISYFEKFAAENNNIRLVMIGQNYMQAQESKNIILTGFISENDKNYILKRSLGLIIPSKYESLSMVTLEAMAEGKTVIVNEECEVLKNHIINSGTGFYYRTYRDFKEKLEKTINLTQQEKVQIEKKAVDYVNENYSWDSIIKKFDNAIKYIADGK